MYKKILSLNIDNRDNNKTNYGEIYEEIIDDYTSKFTLIIGEYADMISTPIPTLLTTKSITKSKMDIVSDITIIKSNHRTSFIINDMHDILNDSKNEYNYFEIVGLYTHKKFRGNKYGQILLNSIIQYIRENYINSVICTYAGASMREYPKEPTGVRLMSIIEKSVDFYKKNGFVSLNDFSNFDNGESMIYIGDAVIIEILNHYKSIIDEYKYQHISFCDKISTPVPTLNKVKEYIHSLYDKIISPKNAHYEIEYKLNTHMCKVIEAKNDEDAVIIAEKELDNMPMSEQIERFLAASAYSGFKVNSINKLSPYNDI